MGQLVLLVVAAAWAAVLVPPLLRSRMENRPNSSVLDFRNQLSSLQRAMPTRVAVRSMGRSLAPSMLSRPAAPGRPASRNVRDGGAISSRLDATAPATRPTRRDPRMQEASLRPRQHGGDRRSTVAPGSRAAEVKRRRANVLFVLVLSAVCAGFLAATTESRAMVYLFALAMVALGGYVYLLVTVNQQEQFGRGGVGYAEREPAPRRQRARRPRPTYREYDDGADGSASADEDENFWESTRPERRPAVQPPRQPPAVTPPADIPGNGTSGRISYGRGALVRPQRRDPRDPYGRDAYGWESGTHEVVRRAPVRNGRHATGQVPVQRHRQLEAVRDDWYSTAG